MNDIQAKILDIFLVVKNICERHGLTYYAIGGTCIGAVRHNGFIPWDDDLDIAVPIEDWDEFWKIMKAELPPYYKVYCGNNIKHYRYVFNKIHDSRTSFIEKAEEKYIDAYKGIFIDVMPIAGIPSDPNERVRFIKSIDKLYKLNFMRRYPVSEMENRKRKILSLLIHAASPVLSYHYFSDRWINLLKRYPLKKSELTGYTWWAKITLILNQ